MFDIDGLKERAAAEGHNPWAELMAALEAGNQKFAALEARVVELESRLVELEGEGGGGEAPKKRAAPKRAG